MKLVAPWLGSLRRAGFVFVVVSAALPGRCAAQLAAPAKSSMTTWACLPEETVVAVRIPDGSALAEVVAGKTKFGAVMFGKERQAAVAKALKDSRSTAWSELRDQLDEFGLTPDHFVQLLAGESGYALVSLGEMDDPENEQGPKFAGLGWLEPGEQRAVQLMEAIAKMIDAQQDADHAITRIDLSLADHDVMQLRVPVVAIEYEEDFDMGEDYEDLSVAEQEEAWEAAREAWEASAVETVRYRTVLAGQVGDQLLAAHSFSAVAQEDAAAGADELASLFGRLLSAPAAGGGGFVTRLGDDPGVARVLALDGVPMMEVLGDLKPLVEKLRATAAAVEMAEKMVRVLGLESLGPFAIRSAFHGSQWRTRMAVAARAPRQGLLRLLDQEALDAEPPPWVPASAMRYQQWSFDLGKAYATIREEVTREFPEESAGAFATVEGQVQGFAQASLAEVLGALGTSHVAVSFGMESTDGDPATAADAERMAMVWRVTDEDLWSRLMKAVAPFAGMAEGLEFTEEQGFSGWRLKQDLHEGGLFLGKGYLVLAYGSGVLESMLSSLNNPPTGADALRGSAVYTSATSMLDMQPSLGVEVADGNRYMGMLHKWLSRQLTFWEEQLEDEEDTEDAGNRQLGFALLRALMPSAKEIDGMMGVIVGRWEVTDDGLFGSSAQEMPAP